MRSDRSGAPQPEAGGTAGPGRELFGSRLGFVLAAVGSAVGLGNMWRFPYMTASNGGAAFVVLYVGMTLLVGVPVMLAEFAVGRRTRASPVPALRRVGGRGWGPVGGVLILTSALILAYLSVVAGWTLEYAARAALQGFGTDPAGRFAEVASGPGAIAFHLVSVGLTTAIVMRGVQRGIERASLVLMPLLLLLLVGLAIWAATLPGASAGYRFYLAPSLEALLEPAAIQSAASQAFYSLSVGMGIMVTYASYLSRREDLGRGALAVSLSDFAVAFVGGLVVFPVIFALGLSADVGESTVGTLFIALPGAFERMAGVGRWVGVAFFVALAVAALTSAVSLLEVVTASAVERWGWTRRRAALAGGAAIAAVGLAPALSLDVLSLLDQVAGELLVVFGTFAMVVLVGRRMEAPEEELLRGAGAFRRFVPAAVFTVRWVLPVVVGAVLFLTLRETWLLAV